MAHPNLTVQVANPPTPPESTPVKNFTESWLAKCGTKVVGFDSPDSRLRRGTRRDAKDLYMSLGDTTRELSKQHMASTRGTAYASGRSSFW